MDIEPGRALHTTGGESTGVFEWGVGSVGKDGWVWGVVSGFSNCPELHSRVLENWTGAQTRMDRGFGRVFQFSLLNDGYYGE